MSKVGDIFYRSWGYDQTNVDFYQIVSMSKTGKTGKAVQINSTADTADGYSERVRPVPGTPVDNPRCTRCSNRHDGPGWDGHAYSDLYTYRATTDQVTVTTYGDHAWRWDGTAKYQTAFGFGH